MKLPNQKTTKVKDLAHMNTMLYSAPKAGKSSWAATIHNGKGVLFAATEKGYNHLEVFKVDIEKWEDFLELCATLSAGDHEYTTLVVDTVDLLIKHCERYICTKHGVAHASDMPFGKGFTLIKDEFIRVMTKVNLNGMSFVFISHSKERELKTKVQTWSYMDTSLSATWSTLVCGMCDFIFYLYTDADGTRKIRTKGTKYINAGDRTGKLPELMDLDFEEIQKCLQTN